MAYVHVGALNITDKDLPNLASQVQSGAQRAAQAAQQLVQSQQQKPAQQPQPQSQMPSLPQLPEGVNPLYVGGVLAALAAGYYMWNKQKSAG